MVSYYEYDMIFIHIGLFYYLLGNIEPKLRSSLKSIQLVACVSTENLEKYGFDTILKPFIQEANTLSKVCAAVLEISILTTACLLVTCLYCRVLS